MTYLTRVARWIPTMASTNTTIFTGLCLSVLYVLWALVSDTLGRPLSDNTLNTVGLFVMGLVGGGIVQFGTKRWTHKPELSGGASAPSAESAGEKSP